VLCRFKDAAYFYWLLLLAKEHEGDEGYELKADLYYAYARSPLTHSLTHSLMTHGCSVHAYSTDPFTQYQPETLFQVSRYIINSLGSSDAVPPGISRSSNTS
jgi:hypothetical protein